MPVDTRLTYEDLVAIPYDGKHHEILRGEHYMTAAPLRRHANAVRNLTFYLDRFVRERQLGLVYSCPVDVVFSEYDVVEPDVVVLLPDRIGRFNERNIQGAPNLVVEVLSESTAPRDRGEKLKLYAKHGVEEYWIVDPDARSVEVYQFGPLGATTVVVKEDQILVSRVLADFSIPVRAILE